MGLGGISIWQLLIILLVVLLLFGSRKLHGLGSDLGAALKGFRVAMRDDQEAGKDPAGSQCVKEPVATSIHKGPKAKERD